MSETPERIWISHDTMYPEIDGGVWVSEPCAGLEYVLKDAQDAKIKALVEALGKLCFEVAGLQAFETEVRREIGSTNYAAIMTKLEDGGKALAAAKEPT